jgi:NFU1 iron-sulfur cluster scaffold homolog, mitochondrial
MSFVQDKTTKMPVMIYTEQTPNPESLKFVCNRMLYPNSTADFRDEASAKEWSPMATALFELPFVNGVYICNNFVTISKGINYDWDDIMMDVKAFIKQWVEADKPILNEGFEAAKAQVEAASGLYAAEDSEIVAKIKSLIDTYVRPAVEMDGGNIEFQSFKDGVVHVELQGSCSGCPSSTVTLKSGIEGMLKRMVPEVVAVEASMG